MAISREMIECLRLAAHARVRIKAWKLTEHRAWRLADEMADLNRESPCEVFDKMKRGNVYIFGAHIRVAA